jgi:hypothetical protein
MTQFSNEVTQIATQIACNWLSGIINQHPMILYPTRKASIKTLRQVLRNELKIITTESVSKEYLLKEFKNIDWKAVQKYFLNDYQ